MRSTLRLDMECAITSLPKNKLMDVEVAANLHNNFVSLDYFSENGLYALKQLLPDDSVVKTLLSDRYNCVYSTEMLGAQFFRAVPDMILTDDVGKYFDKFPDNPRVKMFREMACDDDWNKPDWNDMKPSAIQRSFLGSGYISTVFNGHADVSHFAVPLDNGDHLICYFNCFYHK